MRAPTFGARIVASLALFSFFASTCVEGKQEALGRQLSPNEHIGTDYDAIYGAGLEKAEIKSLVSSDEMPRSTTSTKTTCEAL